MITVCEDQCLIFVNQAIKVRLMNRTCEVCTGTRLHADIHVGPKSYFRLAMFKSQRFLTLLTQTE